MTKLNVWASVVAAASTVCFVAFALSRRASPQRVPSRAVNEPLPEPSAIHPGLADAGKPSAPELPPHPAQAVTRRVVAAVRDSNTQTVAFLRKAPRLSGSDDAEALDPDDLGRDWLARAAQSEPSLGELDLDVELDEIADPTADAAVTEALEAVDV